MINGTHWQKNFYVKLNIAPLFVMYEISHAKRWHFVKWDKSAKDTYRKLKKLKVTHSREIITWKWHFLKWNQDKRIGMNGKEALVKTNVCQRNNWESSPKYKYNCNKTEGECEWKVCTNYRHVLCSTLCL